MAEERPISVDNPDRPVISPCRRASMKLVDSVLADVADKIDAGTLFTGNINTREITPRDNAIQTNSNCVAGNNTDNTDPGNPAKNLEPATSSTVSAKFDSNSDSGDGHSEESRDKVISSQFSAQQNEHKSDASKVSDGTQSGSVQIATRASVNSAGSEAVLVSTKGNAGDSAGMGSEGVFEDDKAGASPSPFEIIEDGEINRIVDDNQDTTRNIELSKSSLLGQSNSHVSSEIFKNTADIEENFGEVNAILAQKMADESEDDPKEEGTEEKTSPEDEETSQKYDKDTDRRYSQRNSFYLEDNLPEDAATDRLLNSNEDTAGKDSESIHIGDITEEDVKNLKLLRRYQSELESLRGRIAQRDAVLEESAVVRRNISTDFKHVRLRNTGLEEKQQAMSEMVQRHKDISDALIVERGVTDKKLAESENKRRELEKTVAELRAKQSTLDLEKQESRTCILL